MSLAHWRPLIACGAILMAFAIGGCDSAGISATPTTVPTNTPVPTSITTVAPIQTPSPSTFSGTYIYDGRPNFIYYLSVTQTDNEVAGFLTIVTAGGKGVTKATTLPLNGTTDSDVVTLYASSTGQVCTLSKTSAEDGSLRLIFSYPTDSGQIVAQEMTPASQYEFNSLLSSWQTELSGEVQFTQDILAKSKKLDDWIKYIEQATGSFDDPIGSLQAIVSTQNFWADRELSDIQGIRDELSTVKEKAAIRPMSCQDAGQVNYYYESMKSYYERLRSTRDQFAKEVSSLETSLNQVAANITSTQDAAQVLSVAMQNGDYVLPDDAYDPWPGDEKTPISNYQAAADAARNQLLDLKATDAANQKTADSLMAEGKAVLDGAKALVNCPP